MIICISGFTGSGKTSLAKRLSEDLGIRNVTNSYKNYSEDNYKGLIEMQKTVKPGFERSFDREIIREAEKQDCVVPTWLGPWMIKNATLRVFLYAGLKTRSKRKAKELKISVKDAEKYVKTKDTQNIKRYKKVYGIDITDTSIFDICINTELFTVDQTAEIISMLSVEKGKKRFR